MSLQERTLVVRNFDPEKTTSQLLKELCIQGGPVRNVVVKPDHAFVEYEDIDSVGYSKALLDGVVLFGRKLSLEPKSRSYTYFKYSQILQDYIRYDKRQLLAKQQQQQQMLAYSNQQLLQGPPQQFAIHPQLQAPLPQPQIAPNISFASEPNINFVQEPNVNIFNFTPYTQASNQFVRVQQQQPSTSMPRGNNDLRRSQSFNHQQHRRNNQKTRFKSEMESNRNRPD